MDIRNIDDKLKINSQTHILNHLSRLNDEEKAVLYGDLAEIDLEKLKMLFETAGLSSEVKKEIEPARCITVNEIKSNKVKEADFYKSGVSLIKQGKTAAFVVAGGQGSRLGFDGPKGAYPVSSVRGKSLFQLHSEKILAAERKYDTEIPFLIMTSQINHEQTVSFFKKNSYFGLNSSRVYIFSQKMIPSLDHDGKLILSGKTEIFKNPDGHGGSLSALSSSGVLDKIIDDGVQYLSYFQVDNPLICILDPVFLALHSFNSSDVSSKAIIKTYPEEKVGVFVQYKDGAYGVEEYSDLPRELLGLRNTDGSLQYAWGSVGIHIFNTGFIKDNTSGGEINLPYHVARKKIKSWTPEGYADIEGYKFEKFVFDAIPIAAKSIVVETVRENEFAPVKNAEGIDSLESSRKLMNGYFREMISRKGYQIPDYVKNIEVSPLLASGEDDFPDNMNIDWTENTYLE